MVSGVDEIDGFVEIVHGNDRQDRCKDLSGTRQSGETRRLPNPGHSLAHQGIIRADVPDDRRSDVIRRKVRVSAEHNGTLGVIQQFLDPIKVSITWEASDHPRLCRSIRIKFQISKWMHESERYRRRLWVHVHFFKGGYEIFLSVLGDKNIIWGDTGLK